MRVQTWENKAVGIGFQEKAVIEEYRKAKVAEHDTLVLRIRAANPDLAKEFDKVDKAL
jgi:hypothetical protein